MSTTATLDRIPAVVDEPQVVRAVAPLLYRGRHRADPDTQIGMIAPIPPAPARPPAKVRAGLRPMAAAIFKAMRRRGGSR